MYLLSRHYFNHVISHAQQAPGYIKSLLITPSKSKHWRLMEQMPPRVLAFETTPLCNANCIFCGYQYDTRPKGIMSMELFKRILDEYVDLGGSVVSLAPMVGEPLMDSLRFGKTFRHKA